MIKSKANNNMGVAKNMGSSIKKGKNAPKTMQNTK
jgi:hypothetical protein